MARAVSPVLVDNFVESCLTTDLVWIVGFSLVTALLAKLWVPLPFTPVPLSGQTVAVLLSGAVLGSRRGFLSQALYLAEGAFGLPVFAQATSSFADLVGQTGGYLWAFPFAAALVGWLVERGASRKVWKLASALVAADLLILFSGTFWLQYFLRTPFGHAWALGFSPFIAGDILKVILVGASLPTVLTRLAPGGPAPRGWPQSKPPTGDE